MPTELTENVTPTASAAAPITATYDAAPYAIALLRL